jgi:hypothetical protein
VVIHLDKYRQARAQRLARRYRREEELMCVNWIPVAGVPDMFSYREQCELSPELPEDALDFDVETFYDRVHGLATQI